MLCKTLIAAVLLTPVLTTLAAPAFAQTLQLPTIHYFATNSSVLVPDQGRVNLGGISRSATGQTQFNGLPGNRGLGVARSAAGVSVSAFVHDFEAWDEALLAEAQRRHQRAGGAVAAARQPAGMAAGSTNAAAANSVADIDQARAAAKESAQHQAAGYLGRARTARDANKLRLARTYYQMAARRAAGALGASVRAELAEVENRLAQNTGLAKAQR